MTVCSTFSIEEITKPLDSVNAPIGNKLSQICSIYSRFSSFMVMMMAVCRPARAVRLAHNVIREGGVRFVRVKAEVL